MSKLLTFTFRLSEQDRLRLTSLAERERRTLSDVLRQLLFEAVEQGNPSSLNLENPTEKNLPEVRHAD